MTADWRKDPDNVERMTSDKAVPYILKEILKLSEVSPAEKEAFKTAIEGIFRAGVTGAMKTVCPPQAGKTYMLPRFWVSKEEMTDKW